MHTVHVSMASGGGYLGLYASFWNQLESMPSGVRFRRSVTAYSGSSAGALAAASLSRGVPAKAMLNDISTGGLGRFKVLRALAVFCRLKKSMYSGPYYYARWARLCAQKAQYNRVPVSIAVTNTQLAQRCLDYSVSSPTHNVVNAAVASASIPYVLPAVAVPPEGLCVDGSVSRASFAEETVKHVINQAKGTLLLLNCIPWPGHSSGNGITGFAKRLGNMYSSSLYDHGMENLLQEVHGFQYQDGIFDTWIRNDNGILKVSDTGDLHIIFVAPSSAQFERCGGRNGMANIDYKASSSFIEKVKEQGKIMANEFAVRYCSLAL